MTSKTSKAEGKSRVVDDQDAYLEQVHQEVRLVRMMNAPVLLTWWLLVINIAFWLAAKFYGMWLGDEGLASPFFNAEQLTFFTGMKVNEFIEAGQWWRLISSQFVHLDAMHILFNAYGIYILGRFIERCYGLRRMLVIYLASGTVGSLASFLTNPVPAGGASGAVYGLVGALMVFGFKYRKSLPPNLSKALTMGLVPWVVLSLAIGFIEAIPMDNAAHIGGLVTGAAIAWVMASRFRQRDKNWTDKAIWTLTVVCVLALVWTLAGWSGEATQCLGGVDAYGECYPELVGEIESLRE